MDSFQLLEQKRCQKSDERDAIQKKTFTKWVNKHLNKNGRNVEDLFVDLQDGYNLIALLEALSAERLTRENGFTRFHRIQNVHSCLDFLRKKHIKLVNIRPEDIVDGNGKLTLGLIWTIILHFQISVINQRPPPDRVAAANGAIKTNGHAHSEAASSTRAKLTESEHLSSRDALLQWARRVTKPYPQVNVTNFTNSWRDGLAFNAILHRYRPNLIDWNKVSDKSVSARERLRNAFDAAHREFGIEKLLDPEDVDVDNPDEKSIITYVSELYNALPHHELDRGLDDIISRLTRGIGITNEKLDIILTRIEEAEHHEDIAMAHIIVDDLNLLERPITEFFEDVELLRQHDHPETNDFYKQVLGLHQRRTAYLDRLGARAETLSRQTAERLQTTRTNSFTRLEESIRWVRERLDRLNNMQFTEQLDVLEEIFEHHKVDNRDIQDYRQTVNECIARQAEVSAEDSYEYCDLLRTLESEYQQLRDLSAGRMLDLDSLIAFTRAAQLELVWIHAREEIEVSRNWSDINQLDLPMLQNYYRQLLHEIEIRESQFNEVHNQGAALINQRHPAVDVIEVYLRTMQTQWDWLLSLSRCLEGHLRDALNVKSFKEESENVEQVIRGQFEELEHNYNRTDIKLEDGERFLRELDEIRETIDKYHSVLTGLTERSAQISPLWQRGVRISSPIRVTAWSDYQHKEVTIRRGDECTLLDNSDLVQWRIRGVDGVEAMVPSVVFRIPPPDPQLTSLLSRLHAEFERLKKLWDRKHRMVRYNMVLDTMRQVRGWDLDTFMTIPHDERDDIIKAVNEDVRKLIAELDPNDPLALRLKDDLRLTNEHFYDLLNRAQQPPEPDHASQYDEQIAELLQKLDEAWKTLKERAGDGVPRNLDDLERYILAHKNFEDALQALDVDVSNVKELYRQIPEPTPTQRANHDHLIGRWEDIWELSRMYVERLKALESVLQGIEEVTDIVRRHEVTLCSFDDMPAALDRLRGVHAQLLELNMVLQQQENIVRSLDRNVAQLRQHVSRTRFNVNSHPDVDRLEEHVQHIITRWDNVCAQVAERLKTAEESQQTQMIYRSQYEEEIQWLDRVEQTIDSLRRPEDLRPEELQAQLDQLTAEYAQLQEHTATIENINKEGGKFIREAKTYDLRLGQYSDSVVSTHGSSIRTEFRRAHTQSKNGAQIVTEELEALNRRFAQLSSVILERKNIVNVLIQNWKRKQQDEFHNECLKRTLYLSSLQRQVEELQRAQQSLAVDFSTPTAAANSRLEMQALREKLAEYRAEIENGVRDVDRLCVEGAGVLTPDEFHTLKENGQKLLQTFQNVTSQTDEAVEKLDIATPLLIEFSTKSGELHSWLYDKSKELDEADLSPGEAAKYYQKRLEDEIESKRPILNRLGDLCTELVNYVGPKEAQELQSTLRSLTERYEDLRRRNQNCAKEIASLDEHVASCMQDAQKLSDWLDAVEHEMDKFGEVAILPEELFEQSEELAKLVMAVTEQEALVSRMVEGSRELGSHSSGGEVAALQYKVEDLRSRYTRIAEESDQKIELLTEAIPLSEEYCGAVDNLQDYLDAISDDLGTIEQVPLEEQLELISALENEVDNCRASLEACLETATQLQHLSSKAKAAELVKQSEELTQHYNDIVDAVTEKADKIRMAEQQSRQTFDELDNWLDWFSEVQDKMINDERPSVDMEYLKMQIKNQRVLNDDIASERSGLRDLVAEASKIARELKSALGGQDAVLFAKIEKARQLADECAELGQARMEELDQAFALCKELDESYTEISEWLDSMEDELRRCEPISTGMRPEKLMQQQIHNNQILQGFQTQKPIVSKFERNIAALSELCSDADSANLKEISDQVLDRFSSISNAFRDRGAALDKTMDQSSQFSDRLDAFLANLEGAVIQQRNNDAPSSRPPVIRRQIADNATLMDLLNEKESAFRAMKATAEEYLAQAKPDDPAVADTAHKAAMLNDLWLEINSGTMARDQTLKDALVKAELFWSEFEHSQQAITGLRHNISTIHASAADPHMLGENQRNLEALQIDIDGVATRMNGLRASCHQLESVVADEERAFVHQHLAGIDAEWDAVLRGFAQLSGRTTDTLGKFEEFSELLRNLADWLHATEQRATQLRQSSNTDSVEGIRQELDHWEAIRRDVDEHAILRERLNQFAAELCATAPAQMASAVRMPVTELNTQWHNLYSNIHDRQQRLQRSMLEMGQFAQAFDQLSGWTDNASTELDTIVSSPSGLKQIEIELCRLRVMQNDIASHQPSFDAIQKAGMMLANSEPHSAASTQAALASLNDKWDALTNKSMGILQKLEAAKSNANSRGNELDKWALWLEDVMSEMTTAKPVGGLPETAHAQLDEFRVLKADVEAKKDAFDTELRNIEEHLSTAGSNNESDSWLQQRYLQMKKDWEKVQNKLVEREKRLRDALAEAIEMASGMEGMEDWLNDAENALSNAPFVSRVPDTLRKQINEHNNFSRDVQTHKDLMKELHNRGIRMQLSSEKKDAIPLKNKLVSLKHRNEKVCQRTSDRTRQLDAALGDSQLYFDLHDELVDWIGKTMRDLQANAVEPAPGIRIREQLNEHKRLQEDILKHQNRYETTTKRGESLEAHAPAQEKRVIAAMNEKLGSQWNDLCKAALKRQRSLEEALVQSGKFDDAVAELSEWLQSTLPELENELAQGRHLADEKTSHTLLAEHYKLAEEASARKAGLDTVRRRADEILNSGDEGADAEGIRASCNKLTSDWERLEKALEERERLLSGALKTAVDFSESVHELETAIGDMETGIHRATVHLPDEEKEVAAQIKDLERMREDINRKRPDKQKVVELGEEILHKCHPRAEDSVRDTLVRTNSLWDQLEQLSEDKMGKLKQHLKELQDHERKLGELEDFVNEKKQNLELCMASEDGDQLSRLETLMEEHSMLKDELTEKQPEVDEVVKAVKRAPAGVPDAMTASTTSLKGTPTRRGSSKLRILQTPDRHHPRSRRQQQTEALNDKWKKLWQETMAHEERLKERKAYLEELKRLENFTFDDWRERYLQWNDNAKARISDLFRKIDRSGTGVVPRQAFIDGVIASKFPTTPLEMARVADEFDKGDGLISSKEFMNALRFDPRKRRAAPKTETERIHEEIARETSRCTCAHRFPITHISSDKDRVQYGFGFGGTMKRMVRILRSTVMVRVGGGWEALDEFLVKHDPCRAKGRINIGMFYDDVRPAGAYDHMEAFINRRRSPAHSDQSEDPLLGFSPGQPGPVMKVREKTDRSMPMFAKPSTPRARGSGTSTPRKASDAGFLGGDASRIPRPSPGVSRSSSRQNMLDISRPSSRCSETSDASERPSRLPSLRAPRGVRYGESPVTKKPSAE